MLPMASVFSLLLYSDHREFELRQDSCCVFFGTPFVPSRAITEGEFIVTHRGTFPYPSVHFEPFLEKFHSNRSSLRTWYTILGLPFGNLFVSIDYAGNRIGNFQFYIQKYGLC